MNKKDEHYVNGPKLHKALKDWYESGEEEIPQTITLAIMQICERLGTRVNFRYYSYLDEMIGDAIVMCIAAVRNKKYDPYKYENPFAYFTQIAYNEFRRIIKSEHKETYIKHQSLMMHMIDSALNGEVIELKTDDSGRLDNLVAKFKKKEKDEDRPDIDTGESKEHSSKSKSE